MQVFLPHPLDDPEVVGAILGAGAEAPRVAARLEDHALRGSTAPLRLGLVPQRGAAAAGSLLALDAAGAARLDFVMAALGASAAEGPVETEAGPVVARWHPAGDAAAPGGELPPLDYLAELAGEVAGHAGRSPAGAMAGLLHGIGFRALARTRGRGRATPARLRTGFGAGDVEVLDLEYSYADYFGVETRNLRHRRFDGRWSPPLRRAVLASGDAVTVLPFDPRRDSVLLIEQFRAGAHARRDPRPWFLEAVAGRCDGLEPPEATARREAEEEAGIALGRLERIAGYYTTPGIAAEFITAFVGEADLGGAGGLHGLASESEDIRALVVPLDTALAAVADGEIDNAPLLLSLFWLQLHRARLADAWG